jgi:hypothetical protein
VRRRAPIGQEVGIDLLLAASDAFAELADELAAEYARRYDEGAQPATLERTRSMAEVAGWWSGRLEAEADYVAGFTPDADLGMTGSGPNTADAGFGNDSERRQRACRRRRPQR